MPRKMTHLRNAALAACGTRPGSRAPDARSGGTRLSGVLRSLIVTGPTNQEEPVRSGTPSSGFARTPWEHEGAPEASMATLPS